MTEAERMLGYDDKYCSTSLSRKFYMAGWGSHRWDCDVVIHPGSGWTVALRYPTDENEMALALLSTYVIMRAMGRIQSFGE